jgi:hypothetical protein
LVVRTWMRRDAERLSGDHMEHALILVVNCDELYGT